MFSSFCTTDCSTTATPTRPSTWSYTALRIRNAFSLTSSGISLSFILPIRVLASYSPNSLRHKPLECLPGVAALLKKLHVCPLSKEREPTAPHPAPRLTESGGVGPTRPSLATFLAIFLVLSKKGTFLGTWSSKPRRGPPSTSQER